MVKKIGVFSDLHGDRNNLELIVKTLKQLGIDHTLFLGDIVYRTMADFTNSELNKAYHLREQLRQESPLRKDVLDGLFSDEQLERYQQIYGNGVAVGKKIAGAEYTDVKAALSDFETIVLGGNWDYREEIEDVFGADYLNGNSKKLSGLEVIGFSGGGSASKKTARDQTLGDDPRDKGTRYVKWDTKLLSKRSLEADILASHVPVTDGEGVEKENAVEHLKTLIKKRKEAGLDVPEVYMCGHRHEVTVKYDEEMEGFMVIPGSCSRAHNINVPTFLVSEFDDDNKLVGVEEYGIYASLAGLSEVRLMGYHKIDWEKKKVKREERDEVILTERNVNTLKNNLTLDDNIRLIQAGLNINYDLVRDNPAELDLLVRKNILVMQGELDTITRDIKTIVSDVMRKQLLDGEGDSGTVAKEIEDELIKKACQVLGADYDSLSASPFAKLLGRSLVKEVLGIGHQSIAELSHTELDPKKDMGVWEGKLADECSQNLSREYQQYMFKDLKPKDFQAMAEEYVPAAYERTKDLVDMNAFQLWKKSYETGLITSGDVEETKAYRKIEGYSGTKRTKKELGKMFNFGLEEEPDLERRMNGLSDSGLAQLRKDIESGKAPVIKGDKGDYVPTTQGALYLDDEIKEGLNYATITMEEHIGQGVKNSELPVIKKGGQEYALVGQGQAVVLDDLAKFGLKEGDYQSYSESELVQRQKDSLISNGKIDLESPSEELSFDSTLDADGDSFTPSVDLPKDEF